MRRGDGVLLQLLLLLRLLAMHRRVGLVGISRPPSIPNPILHRGNHTQARTYGEQGSDGREGGGGGGGKTKKKKKKNKLKRVLNTLCLWS